MENKIKLPSESWENLTLANNFLFCKIMESEPDLCKELLEMLLHIKIDHLEVPQAEKTMLGMMNSKSVRFDVYAKDDNRIFDIEMQTSVGKNLPKRARYYQSIIDVDNLSKGENYLKLKDTYIIFLCLFDIFEKGLPAYYFENICLQDKKLKLNDRSYKVFFNAENCDKLKSEEEKSFFKFLSGEKADSSFTKKIETRLLKAKKNMQWRHQYMTWQQTIDEEKEIAREEGLAEGLAEGLEQGIAQKAISTARNLLQMDILTSEQISKATELPLSEIDELKKELAAITGA